MMQPTAIHDFGRGGLIAVYDDGSEYAFYPAHDDPAPQHRQLVELLKAGVIAVTPRPPRSVGEARDYYLYLVDRSYSEALPSPASLDAQKHKLEEARDVLDMIHTDGGAAELAALDSVQRITRWPMLMAGLGIDGETLESIAKFVHKKAMDLRLTQHAAERARLSLKAAIRQAPTAEAVEAAFLAQGNARADVSGS
jgi:hypothetical protein